MLRKLAIALVALALPAFAHAQALQNYIVPTAPAGTSNNQAASTAFVQGTGSGLLTNLPPFTFVCNPTGITASAIACPALTAVAPLGIAGSILSINNAAPNIFVGGAGNLTLAGTNNIGIGPSALLGLTTNAGNANLAIGPSAGQAMTTGANNVAFGVNALASNTTAPNNIAIGSSALNAMVSGTPNIAIGVNALKLYTGSNSTAIGPSSGQNLTTGNQNTFIGVNAGSAITTGANNVVIGNCTGTSTPTPLAAATATSFVVCGGLGVLFIDYNLTTAATWTIPGATKHTGQIYSTTGLPTIASGACGAATNGTVAAPSTNQSGFITIGAAATTTCTLTWSATLPVAPNACIFFPGNAAAAATGTTVAFAGAPSTTSVILNGTALANTIYRYLCL